MNTSLIENKINITHLDKYAVIIGENPSSGARSPKLWNSAFSESGLNFSMVPLDVNRSKIIDLLTNLSQDDDFIGGSIAAPYKEVVADWLGENITPEAKKISSVNCLYRDVNGKLKGVNTDGKASLTTFENKFGSIKSKSVVILGVGGVGKAVALYFSTSAKSTVIISRSEEGKEYANKINVKWGDWSYLNDIINTVDVVINCTSIGFGDQKKQSPLSERQIKNLKKSTVVFDVIYQPLKSRMLEIAESNGISIFNGLEMNLEQAALAYQYAIKDGTNLKKIRINMVNKNYEK
jgi:shikimate dehydrogenase